MEITERNKVRAEDSFTEEDWLKNACEERPFNLNVRPNIYGDSYQETMNDEFNGKWAYAKRILKEDMGVCGTVLFCNCAYDFYCNLLHWVGMRATAQPMSFGVEQMIVTLFFSMLLMRRWMEFKYYQ